MKRKKEEENLMFERDEMEGNTDFMDLVFLTNLVFLLLKRWKVIIMVAVPIMILGVNFVRTRPNIYKAEATLMLSSGQRKLNTAEMSRNQRMISSYTEIARSKSIMRNVITKLDLDMKPGNVANLVKVTPIDDTEFIKISYMDSNPQKAALLVNEIAREFIIKIKKVMIFENLKIIEKAEVPKAAIPIKRKLIIGVSTILGLMLGIFVVFVMEFFHTKLRKAEDIEKIMGCSVILNIPDFDILEEGEK